MKLNAKAIVPALMLATLIGFSATVSIGYASWTFDNSSAIVASSNDVIVNEWTFSNAPIEQGQTIVIDDDGNITIDGEAVDGSIDTTGGNDTYDNGTVSISVGVDDDGNLVLTEFTTTTTNSISAVLMGSDVYLPTAITIDGASYPITGINSPVSISLSSSWFGTNTIHIPESYVYLCNGAFSSVTVKVTFEMSNTMQSIGSGAFAPANRVTQTINYSGTTAEFEAIDKASDWKSGKGTLKVVCSNGTLTY